MSYRIERKMIHGQMIDVKVYSPGVSGGPAVPKLITDEDLEALAKHERENYVPEFEAYKEGLPVETIRRKK
jgi:hypothetical protein